MRGNYKIFPGGKINFIIPDFNPEKKVIILTMKFRRNDTLNFGVNYIVSMSLQMNQTYCSPY